MSDTTTPSAAEVMGFTDGHRVWDADDDCTLCGAPPERWRVEHCPNGAEWPTPDDMLAWLREHGWDVTVDQAFDGPLLVSVVHFDTHSHAVDPEEPRSTLHAALEAAVIAVGRAG